VQPKAYQIVALLLICIAIIAAVACQVHPAFNDEYAVSSQHHSPSSVHTGLDVLCVVAVLPAILVFLSWIFFAWHAPSWVLKDTAPVFLPFIPPRNTVHKLLFA
jgi:ABC-type Fe3+ transport system permease subunit